MAANGFIPPEVKKNKTSGFVPPEVKKKDVQNQTEPTGLSSEQPSMVGGTESGVQEKSNQGVGALKDSPSYTSDTNTNQTEDSQTVKFGEVLDPYISEERKAAQAEGISYKDFKTRQLSLASKLEFENKVRDNDVFKKVSQEYLQEAQKQAEGRTVEEVNQINQRMSQMIQQDPRVLAEYERIQGEQESEFNEKKKKIDEEYYGITAARQTENALNEVDKNIESVSKLMNKYVTQGDKISQEYQDLQKRYKELTNKKESLEDRLQKQSVLIWDRVAAESNSYEIDGRKVPKSEMISYLKSYDFKEYLDNGGSVDVIKTNDEDVNKLLENQKKSNDSDYFLKGFNKTTLDLVRGAGNAPAYVAEVYERSLENIYGALGLEGAAKTAKEQADKLKGAQQSNWDVFEKLDNSYANNYQKDYDAIDLIKNGEIYGGLKEVGGMTIDNLPYTAAAAITSPIGSVAPFMTMMLPVSTNERKRYAEEGVSDGRAVAGALGQGLIEAGSELLTFRIASSQVKDIIKNTSRIANKALAEGVDATKVAAYKGQMAKEVGKMFENIAQESGSEFFAGVGNEIVEAMTQGREVNWEKGIREGALGAMSGAMMAGTPSSVVLASTAYNDSKLRKQYNANKELVEKLSKNYDNLNETDKEVVNNLLDEVAKETSAQAKEVKNTFDNATEAENITLIDIQKNINTIEQAKEKTNDEEVIKLLDEKINVLQSEKDQVISDIQKRLDEGTKPEAKPDRVVEAEKPTNEQIDEEVSLESFADKTTDELEKRQAEIENSKNDRAEFNEIDKELEKREWQSVLNAPLTDIESVIGGLMQKEKDMPNGFGSYIEKRDARETIDVAKKYQGKVDKETAKKDFKDAFFGNPSSWYADGLKLRESVRAFIEQGGTFKELLSSVQKEFEGDGFSEQDAAKVINRKLSEVSKINEAKTKKDDNFGYRAGNLVDKAETSDKFKGGRSTGHFGTGFYFFGDESKAKEQDKNTNRGISKINLALYNLAKGTIELHEALKRVNNDNASKLDKAKVKSVMNILGIEDSVTEKNPFKKPPSGYVEARNTDELIANEKKYGEENVSEYEKHIDFNFNARTLSDELVDTVLEKYNKKNNKDSASTILMKELGYDGVDSRGTELDNGVYGSVIYDIKDNKDDTKTEQQAPKQEVVAKDKKSLKQIAKDLFGLDDKKSSAVSTIGDKIVETIAKRAGITKEEAYNLISYKKGTKAPDGSLKQDSPIWKSTAKEGLDKLPNNPMQPDAWVKQIADKGGKGTAQELEWIGLSDFLNDWKKENKAKSVPKEVVEQYIADNQIEIVEVTKGRQNYGQKRLQELIALQEEAIEEEDYESAESYERQIQRLNEETVPDKSETKYSNYTLEGGENYREVLLTLPNKKDGYKSSHWDESNILAHIRLNERTLPNGDRVLFIEEVQSDWAQEGKKKGLGTQQQADRIKEINKRLIDIANDISYGKSKRGDVVLEQSELIKERDTLQKSARTPNMPYKKTDQWVGMAMRRVMQMASQEGFDRVAWVTGEQSAGRYDLSKQVDEIRYFKNEDGTFRVNAFQGGGNIFSKNNMTDSEISDTLGKEMAEKISRGDGEKIEGENSLSGDGLKVGGEGMKSFYNSILPKVAKKEAQRFDKKANVDVVEFKGESQYMFDENLNELSDSEKSSEVASKQLSIQITPEMRMNLNGAVPLFQEAKGAMLAEDGRYIIYALTDPNVSTPLHELAHVYEHYLTDSERKAILEWAGHETWSTKTSEKFARGFERYLAEGKYPNKSLKKVFESFKEWLTEIYNGIIGSDIDVTLSPKMEVIYAEMLGADFVEQQTVEETLKPLAKITEKSAARNWIAEKRKQITDFEKGQMGSMTPFLTVPIKIALDVADAALVAGETVGKAVRKAINAAKAETRKLEEYKSLTANQKALVEKEIEDYFNAPEKKVNTVEEEKQGGLTEKDAYKQAFEEYVDSTKKKFKEKVNEIKAKHQKEIDAEKRKMIDEKAKEKAFQRRKKELVDYAKEWMGDFSGSQFYPSEFKSAANALISATTEAQLDIATKNLSRVIDKSTRRSQEQAANKMRAKMKGKTAQKVGNQKALGNKLITLLNLDPKRIPDELMPKYLEILEKLTSPEPFWDERLANKKLNELAEGISKRDKELERAKYKFLNNFNPDKGSVSSEVDRMVKERILTEKEGNLIKTFKDDFKESIDMAQEQAAKEKAREENKEKADELKKEISKNKVKRSDLSDVLDKALIEPLVKLTNEALDMMTLAELKAVKKGIDDIKIGKRATKNVAEAAIIASKYNKNINVDLSTKRGARWYNFLAKLGALVRPKRGVIQRMIESNPVPYIDQVLGDFKSTEIYKNIFYPTAQVIEKYQMGFQEVAKTISESVNNFKDDNAQFIGEAKVSMYMQQLEHESNPNSTKTNSAKDWLDATLEDNNSPYSEESKAKLAEIYSELTKNGDTAEAMYKNLNKQEVELYDSIRESLDTVSEKAIYSRRVGRGDETTELNNYVPAPVYGKGTDEQQIAEFNQRFTSTEAGSTKERTGKAHAVNYSVSKNAIRSVQQSLMDYNLSQELKATNRALNEMVDSAKTPEQRQIAKAIRDAYKNVIDGLLYRETSAMTSSEAFANWIKKKGYLATLGGLIRPVAEISSNLIHAGLTNRLALKKGFDMMRSREKDLKTLSELFGSTQLTRFFGEADLNSKRAETNSIIRGKSRTVEQFVPDAGLLKKAGRLGGEVDDFITKEMSRLTSYPDEIMGRLIFIGETLNQYEKLAGQELDIDKFLSDQDYRDEVKDTVDEAVYKADMAVIDSVASSNPASGIIKNQIQPSKDWVSTMAKEFDVFMTRFRIFEFNSTVKAINGMLGRGELTREEATFLFTATITRMVTYNLIRAGLYGALMKAIVGIPSEDEDDEEWYQELLTAALGAIATLSLGSAGNIVGALYTSQINNLNEWLGEGITYTGDYDKYKNQIMFQTVDEGYDGNSFDVGRTFMNMTGAYSPFIKLINKNAPKVVDDFSAKTVAHLLYESIVFASAFPKEARQALHRRQRAESKGLAKSIFSKGGGFGIKSSGLKPLKKLKKIDPKK